MPASQFFVMLEAAREIRNKELVLSCWSARAGTVGTEGFHEILEFMGGLDKPKIRPPDVVIPKREPLKGESARRAVMGAFWSDRRIHGGKSPVKH